MGMQGAGMAANVVGSAIQMIAAAEASKNMKETFQREQGRTNAFRSQAYAQLDPFIRQSGVETAREGIKQGKDNRLEQYARLGQSPLRANQQGQGGVTPYTMGEGNFAKSTRNTRAQLGGYGDWQHQRDRAENDTNQALGKVYNFATGHSQVFPYLMYDAQHSMDALAEIGQMISSIGGAAANAQQFSQMPQMPQRSMQVPQQYGVAGGVDYNPQLQQNLWGTNGSMFA